MDGEITIDERNLKHWPCCPLCGASCRDGTMCRNCLAYAAGQPLILMAQQVHAPSTKEKEWTLCGVWNPGTDTHPVYKQQQIATRSSLVTCPLCIGRIEQYNETGIPPRKRPM